MPREQKCQAIILKQSAFSEADEIITFYTREAGKVRALAKSVKLPTSKLRHGLQPMFFASVTLISNSKLPKVIGVAVADAFANIAADSERVKRWYVASELINKATPDEQKNEKLFQLLLDFLTLLNWPPVSSPQTDQPQIYTGFLEAALLKFKLELLSAIGLGIWHPAELEAQPRFFSNTKGGFFNTRLASDAVSVTLATWQAFLQLNRVPMTALGAQLAGPLAGQPIMLGDLSHLVSDFLVYHLEREIKAEKFLV